MGLTVAPSLAKSCSPRIRLGPWLRLFHRLRFSPPSVSALSASPRITQTPAHHPSCIHSPGGLPAGSLCGDRAPTAPGSAGVEQSRGLGVVISQTVMERCEGGQGGNTGSKQQPGLSGETGAPGASGNRGSHGPMKDVPEPPGGTCFIPRYVHRSQTGGGSKSSDVLCALRAGPLHPVRVLVAGDSGIRVPYPFVSALCEVYALSTLVSSVTCKHWMLKLKHIN